MANTLIYTLLSNNCYLQTKETKNKKQIGKKKEIKNSCSFNIELLIKKKSINIEKKKVILYPFSRY